MKDNDVQFSLVNIVRIDVRINVQCVIVFLICFFKAVVCNNCGSLSYSHPAIKGRNVKIIFKPIDFSATEEPIFYYSDIVCNNCGSLSYSLPAIKGRNVTIIFKPIDFSATEEPIFYYDDTRAWTPVASPIVYNLTLGVFITVFDTTLPNNGYLKAKYRQCTSPYIPLDLQVPPGLQFLQPKKIVAECPECLVVFLGEDIFNYLVCKTSRDTHPSIKIGDEEGVANRETHSRDIYRISRKIREEDHMKTVTCSVSNAASKQSLTTSATLYVAFQLATPELNVPILREGIQANVTCISRTARPATNLDLWIRGKYPLPVYHVKTYDNSTRTYTTTITLNKSASKDWNKKVVICKASSPLFEEKMTQWKTINCIYPPSTLQMNEPRQPSRLQDIYNLEYSCFMDNYNDFCWISWTRDGQPYAKGKTTYRIHNSSVIVFTNVSKENNGQNITCRVTCSNIKVELYKSHIVQVPYQPIVHLSVKDELLINARDTAKVTCTAKSIPLSDIVWSVKGDTQIHVCNKSQECGIHINPVNITEHRNYTCTAYFKFGTQGTSATSSFLAVRRGEDSSLTTDSKGISIEWIVVGLVGLLAVVIISTAIVFARKLFLKENTHGNLNEQQPVQHDVTAANVQENEIEELNEDPTYAQVDKTRRTRPETEECKAKGGELRDLMESPRVTTDVKKQGSDRELVYADLDIEHLEKARKLMSRQRETTPTVYDDVDFTRTKSGSNK